MYTSKQNKDANPCAYRMVREQLHGLWMAAQSAADSTLDVNMAAQFQAQARFWADAYRSLDVVA